MRTVQGYEECGRYRETRNADGEVAEEKRGWRERTRTVGTRTDRLTMGLGFEDSDNTALYTARESEVQGNLSPIACSSLGMWCSDSEAAT